MRTPNFILVAALLSFLAGCDETMSPGTDATADTFMTNDEYFASLDGKEGIEKRESGLYFEVLEEGTGQSPTRDSTVRVHYHGLLIDETVFDSSRRRGEPAEFTAGALIPGFTEGLLLMKEGGKARLHIPPEIGYGRAGAGPIPGNSVLIFEVELIDVL